MKNKVMEIFSPTEVMRYMADVEKTLELRAKLIERRYTEKPEDYDDRNEYKERFDYCNV